jgi:hypothetical protein
VIDIIIIIKNRYYLPLCMHLVDSFNFVAMPMGQVVYVEGNESIIASTYSLDGPMNNRISYIPVAVAGNESNNLSTTTSTYSLDVAINTTIS